MKLIISDLESKDLYKLFPNPTDEMIIISNKGPIHHCIGCFGCWIKTPAACVIRDKYGDMGETISKCNELLIISECCYGGFSPFVKNVLDRSISYIHPYFAMRNGEMHHRRRYENNINMQVWFYGKNITEKEKLTAQKLVRANSINFDSKVGGISFFNSPLEMEGQLL